MKKIVFITGTRADYGKLKVLIQNVENSEEVKVDAEESVKSEETETEKAPEKKTRKKTPMPHFAKDFLQKHKSN